LTVSTDKTNSFGVTSVGPVCVPVVAVDPPDFKETTNVELDWSPRTEASTRSVTVAGTATAIDCSTTRREYPKVRAFAFHPPNDGSPALSRHPAPTGRPFEVQPPPAESKTPLTSADGSDEALRSRSSTIHSSNSMTPVALSRAPQLANTDETMHMAPTNNDLRVLRTDMLFPPVIWNNRTV
jgi:hypothetical protein